VEPEAVFGPFFRSKSYQYETLVAPANAKPPLDGRLSGGGVPRAHRRKYDRRREKLSDGTPIHTALIGYP
jgi:hypothetical protein